MKYISAKEAAELDEYLMSDASGFSIDQLMELAGLSVASALQRLTGPCKVLIICGPGNNGGDGLVAARHLALFGYNVSVLFPKRKAGPGDIYARLVKQLAIYDIPLVDKAELDDYEYIIDAIFGFSFSGEVRAPFDEIIGRLTTTKTPVLSVDVPSSWTIDDSASDNEFKPAALISLSAPKPCSRDFQGRHFLGGRFMPAKYRQSWDLPTYAAAEQSVEITGSKSSL